jgi:hypothetical protein
MKVQTKFCSIGEIPYGFSALKPEAALRYKLGRADSLLGVERQAIKDLKCCIRDCDELIKRRRRGDKASYCPNHGISMSIKPTYVYSDGRRNFIVGTELLKCISKVERWRLGFETSEDALTWNVFVGLYVLDGLSQAFEKLTGISPAVEPELYLWGNRIDSECKQCEKLKTVRRELEKGFSIPTEPDVMLCVPGQAIVLIEAKFGSSNPRLVSKKNRFGSVNNFLNLYKCRQGSADPLNRKWISGKKDDEVLEQLCRNAIFAHWLASEGEQPVLINLVRENAKHDGQLFGQHLSENIVHFHIRNWEELYTLPVMQRDGASVLRSYLRNKTLNLVPAFNPSETT